MRTHDHPFRLTVAVAVIGLAFAQLPPQQALAQGMPPPPPGQDSQASGDPPARVGRLARVSGTVSYHTQDDSQWSPAVANYPVVAGTAFWTEPSAQADIDVSASRITLASGTELDIATLDDTAFQAVEPQGETYLRVQPATPNETHAVQTPRGLVTLALPGRYGVVAGDTQNPTVVTVIDGSAQVTGPDLSLQIGPNQAATITGADTFQGEIGPAQRDAFITAMLERERPPQPQQVAPPPAVAAMPGAADLTQYGSWAENPEYGEVWYPEVAPDWVPYRDGRWDYVGPWGWTWVDSAPWGFAPFHYGRWARFGNRWGWYPGTERRPHYAPALVTFLGVGGVVGVGIGAALAAGRVGWLPLGPREPYHPWYRASDRYVRQINGGHVSNGAQINRNMTVNSFVNRGAATVVPTSVVTGSRPVGATAQRLDAAQLSQTRPVFGQPVRPTMATAGMTPAVARQLNLGQTPGASFQRPVAPGPAIRPIGAQPAPATGAAVRTALPPLHSPSQFTPASAGVRPLTGQPPPATQGAPPSAAMPGATARPALGGPPTQQALPVLRAPVAAGRAGPPPIEHPSSGAAPAAIARPFAAPGAVGAPAGQPPAARAPATLPPGPTAGHVGPPAIVRPIPPVTNPAASLPLTASPPGRSGPPPTTLHPATSPPAAPLPAVVRPPPAPVPSLAPTIHAAPPPAFHAPPPQQPVVHAAPPPGPAFRSPSVQAPPQVVHAAPPPPPVIHAAPPQVIHAPPPAPIVHAAPPPPAPHPQPAPGRPKRPGEP
jgi:hypothetical protein